METARRPLDLVDDPGAIMTPAASAAATTPATTTADTALQPKSRDAEQVAAHAADGYARQTGKLGCVVSTAGPGCTNAMTGIATAFRSENPERVADMISMAARGSVRRAPGPVYLEMPRDIEKLAHILVNSERPAILYGQQIWAARGHEDAIALLPGLDIPGYFNGGSRALPPPGDPHHFDRTRGNAFSLRRRHRRRHRRHPVRFPHGHISQSAPVSSRANRHELPQPRREPGHRPRAGPRSGGQSLGRCCTPPPAAQQDSARRASDG